MYVVCSFSNKLPLFEISCSNYDNKINLFGLVCRYVIWVSLFVDNIHQLNVLLVLLFLMIESYDVHFVLI